nr:MAG TPA: hypothetical protein [Bacteriophage sp.]
MSKEREARVTILENVVIQYWWHRLLGRRPLANWVRSLASLK